MTTHIDLFGLFTVDRREMERTGGAFVELLNPNQDGVVYMRLDLIESVNEAIANTQQGGAQ